MSRTTLLRIASSALLGLSAMGCKRSPQGPTPLRSGSDSLVESHRHAAGTIRCKDSTISVWEDTAEGDQFVKVTGIREIGSVALVFQSYYEGEGGLIYDKEWCRSTPFSGRLAGGSSPDLYAFFANNDEVGTVGIQIFRKSTFLEEVIQDYGNDLGPDTAWWADESTLVAKFSLETGGQPLEKLYSHRQGIWTIGVRSIPMPADSTKPRVGN